MIEVSLSVLPNRDKNVQKKNNVSIRGSRNVYSTGPIQGGIADGLNPDQ